MKTLRGLVTATHIGPTLAVTALAALLAAAFSVPWGTSLLVVLTVFLNQASVGISNDACDARRDTEANRADKPIARGDVTARLGWAVALGAAVGSLVLSFVVHPLVGAWQAVFLVAGWAYNLGLKSTVWSAACYAVGFGALPVLVSYATTTPQFPPGWVVFVASALGVSAHFANVLPDLLVDHRQGVTGLPQRLGRRWVPAVLVALTLTSGLVLVWGGGLESVGVTVPAAVVALGLAVVAAVLTKQSRPSDAPFRLSMAAALVMALGLAVGSGL